MANPLRHFLAYLRDEILSRQPTGEHEPARLGGGYHQGAVVGRSVSKIRSALEKGSENAPVRVCG